MFSVQLTGNLGGELVEPTHLKIAYFAQLTEYRQYEVCSEYQRNETVQ